MESGSQGFVNVAIEVDLFFPPLGLYLESPVYKAEPTAHDMRGCA